MADEVELFRSQFPMFDCTARIVGKGLPICGPGVSPVKWMPPLADVTPTSSRTHML
jgi:hypothetical protein